MMIRLKEFCINKFLFVGPYYMHLSIDTTEEGMMEDFS